MASALMFGTGATRRRARHRPHRPPADPRRQPAGLQRQPDDRARHARAAARDPRARRQGRRGRPAAHAHRARGRRAPLHPPGHRRAAAVRARAHAVRRGARRRRARSPTHVAGLDEVRALAADFTPEARRRACGIAAPDDPAPGARAGAAPQRRGLRADRHHARSGSARWRAGWSTCSTCSPATSTGPAARCSRARPPARRTRPASPGAGAARPSAAGTAACAGCAEVFGELPVGVPGRGDRDAGRRARSAR